MVPLRRRVQRQRSAGGAGPGLCCWRARALQAPCAQRQRQLGWKPKQACGFGVCAVPSTQAVPGPGLGRDHNCSGQPLQPTASALPKAAAAVRQQLGRSPGRLQAPRRPCCSAAFTFRWRAQSAVGDPPTPTCAAAAGCNRGAPLPAAGSMSPGSRRGGAGGWRRPSGAPCAAKLLLGISAAPAQHPQAELTIWKCAWRSSSLMSAVYTPCGRAPGRGRSDVSLWSR